jgi:hypothetical protein
MGWLVIAVLPYQSDNPDAPETQETVQNRKALTPQNDPGE